MRHLMQDPMMSCATDVRITPHVSLPPLPLGLNTWCPHAPPTATPAHCHPTSHTTPRQLPPPSTDHRHHDHHTTTTHMCTHPPTTTTTSSSATLTTWALGVTASARLLALFDAPLKALLGQTIRTHDKERHTSPYLSNVGYPPLALGGVIAQGSVPPSVRLRSGLVQRKEKGIPSLVSAPTPPLATPPHGITPSPPHRYQPNPNGLPSPATTAARHIMSNIRTTAQPPLNP